MLLTLLNSASYPNFFYATGYLRSSEIVALMSLVQIVYQFYLYPYVVFNLFFICRSINLPL
jgi:hypothetical protein